ncbi:TBPIP-domain-containing protein [Atractiella rhizophila]|nr:TBPIP-domain-containing protein [Atractiella rhizophila]
MPPKKEKIEQVKGDAAETLILDYLRKSNRPYNSADIAANLKSVSKPVTTKALQVLADRGDLQAKTYGKQIIYAVKQLAQDDIPTVDASEIEAWKQECEELKRTIASLKQELKNDNATLHDLKSQPETSELPAYIAQLDEKIEAHKARLAAFKSSSNQESGEPCPASITAADLDRQKHQLVKAIPFFLARKKKFFEVLEGIKPEARRDELIRFAVEEIGTEFDVEEELLFEKKCKNLLENLKCPGKKRKREE